MLDHIIYMIKFARYSAILADFCRICQTEEILTNEIYERYILDTSTQTATVKKEIAYEQVDVSDEIKDESEKKKEIVIPQVKKKSDETEIK